MAAVGLAAQKHVGQALGRDAPDMGAAVAFVGKDPGLSAGEGAGGRPQPAELDRHQRGRTLFPGRDERVHLPQRRRGVDGVRHVDQLVCGIARRGDDDDKAVPLALCAQHDPGRAPQPFQIREGAAAEFLNKQHGGFLLLADTDGIHSILYGRNKN